MCKNQHELSARKSVRVPLCLSCPCAPLPLASVSRHFPRLTPRAAPYGLPRAPPASTFTTLVNNPRYFCSQTCRLSIHVLLILLFKKATIMTDKCIICDKDVTSDCCEVLQKGIQGLIKASKHRKDGKHILLTGIEIVVVHGTCRKRYTRSSSIIADLREPSPSTSSTSCLRSSQQLFEFQSKCLFCAEAIDEKFYAKEKKKPKERRREVYPVRSLHFSATIVDAAKKRNDEWGNNVFRRIINTGDLVAAEGIYHVDCYKRFLLTHESTRKSSGRPKEEYVSNALEQIQYYMEQNKDSQITLDEIMEQISGEKPVVETVKSKLKEIYGDRILISHSKSHKSVICFRDTGHKILNETWYNSQCEDQNEERLRIVRTAAMIIKQDVQSRVYDTSHYAPSGTFLDDAESMIPESLKVFLEALLIKKTGDKKTMRKVISLAHSIISIIRPRSFISPVLHGIAFFIHRKFCSRSLLDLLVNLGFSGSYYDATMLELSAIYHTQEPLPPGTFTQFVFDNADFNVATLDGLNTFHSMGGISCITPAESIPPGKEIKKLTKAPTSTQTGTLGVLQLQTFNKLAKRGLKQIIIQDVNQQNPLHQDTPVPNLCDMLWICGKWLEVINVPEWKGFMRCIQPSQNFDKSAVIPLPFIISSPTDYDTIYTALNHAADQCLIETCFVTFDLPLYIKARDIVASSQDDPKIKSIVVRLGGFHMLMSYLGCIGHIMVGSGLRDLLCNIFAPNSVDQILSGHAYARAVRAHLLVHTTLSQIILNDMDVSDEEKATVNALLKDMLTEPLSPAKIIDNEQLTSLQSKMINKMNILKENGPTAALWVQYYHMVTIMKQFIAAERSGDWKTHLSCVQRMIPFFHASGHFQYARCAHLYLQDMIQLETRMKPHEFVSFAQQGYFTIRRGDSFWSGVWSDMTIEQTLMRNMKSCGGMTRGRGITNSTLAKWLQATITSNVICSSLEAFSGVFFSSGDQHIDLLSSRQCRDQEDRKKLYLWYMDHYPFPTTEKLTSLSTGIVGSSEVNCHLAEEVGKQLMGKALGNNFADVKLQRKDKVLSLGAMNSAIKINNETVVIDPLLLFQRIAIAKKSDKHLASHLEFELAPYPLALFNEGSMRKTQKAALYEVLPKTDTNVNLKTIVKVIDGGFLLHRTKWQVGASYSDICDQYINYVKCHYGSHSTVVFDGYDDIKNSTKTSEQKRRGAAKSCVDINFNLTMKITVQQEHFLSNTKNKSRLIELLSEKMQAEKIETRVAASDADCTIIRIAIDKAANNPMVAVVGEDVDLVVLLMALTPPAKEIFFVKPGRGKVETSIFSSRELQKLSFCCSILFLHSFSGCDTTSAIFRKGKAYFVKLFGQNPLIKDIAAIFYDPTSTQDAIAESGERMFLAVYRAPSTQIDLNSHRYSVFVKSSIKPKTDLSSLPPTKGSAKYHAFRVYHQVQEWLGNQLPPEMWGWKRGVDGNLEPITTLDPAAPDTLLKSIFCHCKSGCSGKCSCRKAGINCSHLCNGCLGACTNGVPVDFDEKHDDDDDDHRNDLIDNSV